LSNELIRPLDPDSARALEESAKLGQKFLDSADKAGNYATGVLGRLPHNLLGFVDDWVLHQRVRRYAQLQADTKRILEQRGVKEPYPEISPSIAVPLLEAAVDENRDDIRDLWAKLLAAAIDPNRSRLVRLSIIAIVKQMDPMDALILKAVYENATGMWSPNGRDFLSKKFNVSEEEVLVSFDNLSKLIVSHSRGSPNQSAPGACRKTANEGRTRLASAARI